VHEREDTVHYVSPHGVAMTLAAMKELMSRLMQDTASSEQDIHKSGQGSLTRESFGVTLTGAPVDAYTLTNANGLEIRFMSYGGIILSIKTPDRNGMLEDVVMGFDRLGDYLKESPYFGAIVGRYSNRIAKGRFTVDGREYLLARNDGVNHLHGGKRGFDKAVWGVEPFAGESVVGAVLTYTSRADEEGYPGTLYTRVTYTLTDADELRLEYHASSDQATPVNLTQHTYFNLAGDGKRDILDHELTVVASRFTPVDHTLIPTGELRDVTDTPFDFRQPMRIGARIDAQEPQLRRAGGYDHNLVLDRTPGEEATLGARLHDAASGRVVEVYTTEPGVQLYTGNFLDGTIVGKRGRIYRHRFGVALETQHFPDSPNQPSFPSTIVAPGHDYHSHTTFRFSVV
jgi:aldose 1-epimerase